MNKSLQLFFLFCFLYCVSFSQTKNISHTLKIPATNTLKFYSAKPENISVIGNPCFLRFHNELPRGAVFFRMEESLRNKFNIWVKLRAGSDEAYLQAQK